MTEKNETPDATEPKDASAKKEEAPKIAEKSEPAKKKIADGKPVARTVDPANAIANPFYGNTESVTSNATVRDSDEIDYDSDELLYSDKPRNFDNPPLSHVIKKAPTLPKAE